MNERGSVSLFFVLAVTTLLAFGGLVADGGAGLSAMRRANDIAEQAARAGVHAGARPENSPGDRAPVDALAAGIAADAYLAAEGMEGTVEIIGDRVAVTVRVAQPTTLLRLVGIDQFKIEGRGEAAPAVSTGSAS